MPWTISGSLSVPRPEDVRQRRRRPFAATSTKTTATASGNLKQRRLIEVNRQRFGVAIGNGLRRSAKVLLKTIQRLKLARLLNRDSGNDAVVDGNS
jgi:hypothetical protein